MAEFLRGGAGFFWVCETYRLELEGSALTRRVTHQREGSYGDTRTHVKSEAIERPVFLRRVQARSV